jgi:hypothetical protein
MGLGTEYGRPAMLHRLAELIPWNRFLGPLEVYKFELSGVLGVKNRPRLYSHSTATEGFHTDEQSSSS